MSSILFSVSLDSVKGASSFKGEGRGVVEKKGKDGSAVIRLSNGTRITVELPDDHGLKAGDRVVITKNNGYIVIEKEHQDPLLLKKIADSVSIKDSRSFSEILNIASKVISSVNIENLSRSDIENLKKIISILNRYDERFPPEIKKALKDISDILSKIELEKPVINSNVKNGLFQNFGKLQDFIRAVRHKMAGGKGSIKVVTNLREGYYFFQNKTEAESWLQNNTEYKAVSKTKNGLFGGKTGTGSAAESMSAKNSTVSESSAERRIFPPGQKKNLFIYVTSSTDNNKTASVYSETEIKPEIRHFFQENLSSRILRSIPADVIKNHIAGRESFDVNDIKQIDKLFTLFEKQPDEIYLKENTEMISGEVLKNSFEHIAGLIKENRNGIPPGIAAAIYKSAEILLPRIQEIFTLGREELEMIAGGLYMDSETVLDQKKPEHNTNVIFELIQKLGLTYENDILNSRSAPSTNIAGNNIKFFLLSVMEAIDNAVKNGEKSVNDKLKPEEITEIVRTVLKSMNKKTDIGQSLRGNDTLTVYKFREQIEGVIKNIESFQLMAKNTSGPQGDQQMLIIPVMIGGEWKETRIRFTKRRRSGKTDRNSRHFTVNLNIDPGQLGKINVNMDHFIEGGTSIDMRFEKPAVTKWFMRRRKGIYDSLKRAGLKNVSISINSIGDKEAYWQKMKSDKIANIEIWG